MNLQFSYTKLHTNLQIILRAEQYNSNIYTADDGNWTNLCFRMDYEYYQKLNYELNFTIRLLNTQPPNFPPYA